MSKIADVFGRFEAFVVCVVLLTIGYIQQAGANNVKTYGAAQIFYSAGATGLQILQQIFIADTSDLLNRALCATIPDLPFLVNVWIGAPLANYILENLNWRWGYGIWAIILPVAFMPLACSLWISQRRAARRGLLPEAPYAGKSFRYVLRDLWYEMDFFGLVLLSAAISLILIPLTLAARAHGAWANPSILGMLVVGGISLVAFPLWESSERLAPHAFFPKHLLRKRTVLAGVAIAFFYFSEYFVWLFISIMLTTISGILPISIPILLLVPTGGPEPVGHGGRAHYSDVHLHVYRYIDHHLFPHQVHKTLQIPCHDWLLHLSCRHWPHDKVSYRGRKYCIPCRLPGSRRYRRCYDSRTCTAGRAGFGKPLRSGHSDCYVPHPP